jgi:RNA polymerase sigma-70 factor (ECF subfamily)
MLEKLTMVPPNDLAPPAPSDRARIEQMFAAHHATVWRTMRRLGLSPDAAADATQDTFLVAVQRLGDIQPDSERAFLVGTAIRVAHTQRRKNERWTLDEDMDQRVSRIRDTDDSQADLDLCDLALSKITPELAQVFVLYEIEEFTSPEIAALLHIPLGSVASRLRRAREQFRIIVSRIERIMQQEGKL